MAKVDVLDILRCKQSSRQEITWDSMMVPPINYYLTPYDVESLHQIAISNKLSAKIEVKYDMINQIMVNRGFKRFSAGTNRVVYKHLEDPRFVAKIAVDRVGMQDNPLEYRNQHYLKPYVTKMFHISPCGTVGFAERVLPVKNVDEFKLIAEDVFYILVFKILGHYVIEDVGTKYFMNWGIRTAQYVDQGPCLLDYPYVYKIDGNKLFCSNIDPITGIMCDGEIDYDPGFNALVCTKCGKRYLASDLKDDKVDNRIIIKGGTKDMKVAVVRGNKIIETNDNGGEMYMTPPKVEIPRNTTLKVVVEETKVDPKSAGINRPIFKDIGVKTRIDITARNENVLTKEDREKAYLNMTDRIKAMAREKANEKIGKDYTNIGDAIIRSRLNKKSDVKYKEEETETKEEVVEVIPNKPDPVVEPKAEDEPEVEIVEIDDIVPTIIDDDFEEITDEEDAVEETPIEETEADFPEDDEPEEDYDDFTEVKDAEESEATSVPVIYADSPITTSSRTVGLSQIPSTFIPDKGDGNNG